MEDKNKSIFRQKALSQVNTIEDLSDYIRVTTPSAWLLILAVMVILASLAVWGFFGSVPLTDSNGVTEQVRPIELLIGEQVHDTPENTAE
ncbi:MAG: hypothetical protein LBL80_01105 [Ruminococcus sp.]|jgi:hypothetical protein|nr:hypothetical protein [Ruminococcus sp.]